MLLDHLVHLGLGVGRLVGLVVTEAAVADQVDQHVMAELLPERERKPHRRDAGLHVVGVDVDDRYVEALCQVGCPGRRAGVLRVGGEADLVVLDQVDGAADGVAVERLEVERLGDHSLRGEGGVAVEDDRDRGVGVLVGVWALSGGLRGAGGAGGHGVDELQMGRVRLQADDDRLAALQLVGALGAVVVLDIARPALGNRRDRLERRGSLELGEDRVVGTAEVVREHVQPTTVRHADHDLAGAAGGGQLDQLIQHRDGHVESLDRELLLAQVGLVHEALERVDLRQALEQRLLLLVGERLAELPGLDLLPQPQALLVRRDVLDLVGDRAAVGLAQMRQRVGERLAGDVDAQDPGRDPGHQLGRELERLRVERRVALGLAAERIELGGQMPVRTVSLDERGRGLDGLEHLLVGNRRSRGRGRGPRGAGGPRRFGERRKRRDPEIREHPVVEAVLALEVGLDPLQEAAGLGALDDAMVVGGGHRHDLLDPGDASGPDGGSDGPGGDDRALTDHQPGDGCDGPDAARVRETQIRAAQIIGGQAVGSRLLDERVVRRPGTG